MDIDSLRKQINEIDDELSELFERRMDIAARIGEYKRLNNLPVTDAGREREIIARITSKQSKELCEYAERLFATLFELSREYQEKLTVSGGGSKTDAEGGTKPVKG